MRRAPSSWSWPLIVLLLAAASGCDRDLPAAAEAARPVTQHRVGPLPGPATASPQRSPLHDDAKAIVDGRRYFVAFNCSGCHGGRAGGGMGPSLRDADWLYGKTDGDIFDSIAEGRGKGMPAWGTLLPADTIWRLTAYITSLRTPAEPDAPG